MQDLRDSNDAREDPWELQRRIADEGYLFFRQLQSREKLLKLRREMMTVIQQGGWLAADTDPSDGIADLGARCTEGDIAYTDVYHAVYRLEAFHRSAHWPEVMDMVERISGRPAMPLPQKVARIWFPQYTEHTTPTHQDFVHFQGNFQTLTCWAPIGDCPRELGGLAVLRGSHHACRVMDHRFSLGAGSLNLAPEEYDEDSDEWLTTDYEAGDTLFFPALTVHKAMPNLTADRMRLSLDNRYTPLGEPVADHMLEPHLNVFSQLTWDDVYRDWSATDLQYYWKSLDLKIIPRDMQYLEKGFGEAIQLAKAGDPLARHYLQRFVTRDPESREASAAREALGIA